MSDVRNLAQRHRFGIEVSQPPAPLAILAGCAIWIVALATVALLLSGCATARVGIDHISHPLAGWPCGPVNEEAQLTQIYAGLHWQRDGWYLEAGLGWKLFEKSQWDFVGPKLTGTVRIGREFRLVMP